MDNIPHPSTLHFPALAKFDATVNGLVVAAKTRDEARAIWSAKVALKRALERAPLGQVNDIARAWLVVLCRHYPDAEVCG